MLVAFCLHEIEFIPLLLISIPVLSSLSVPSSDRIEPTTQKLIFNPSSDSVIRRDTEPSESRNLVLPPKYKNLLYFTLFLTAINHPLKGPSFSLQQPKMSDFDTLLAEYTNNANPSVHGVVCKLVDEKLYISPFRPQLFTARHYGHGPLGKKRLNISAISAVRGRSKSRKRYNSASDSMRSGERWWYGLRRAVWVRDG